MLKISNFEVIGWEHAIRGMRNPMNSWEKSDSRSCYNTPCSKCDYFVDSVCTHKTPGCNFVIGQNDLDLMTRLSNAGPDHRKFMRMITAYVDIIAPLYWWKEFDTYKVGTVANSCSTMHKIAEKEFMLDDFSTDHLQPGALITLDHMIDRLNYWREEYLKTNDKSDWWQMIQLLPSSYNQKRTVMLNYEVLANIYKSRRNHKLDEWHTFCDWIEELPYSELITDEMVCLPQERETGMLMESVTVPGGDVMQAPYKGDKLLRTKNT